VFAERIAPEKRDPSRVGSRSLTDEGHARLKYRLIYTIASDFLKPIS
jgi:hypothetical protein